MAVPTPPPIFVKGASRVWRIESVSSDLLLSPRRGGSCYSGAEPPNADSSSLVTPGLAELRWEDNSDSDESEGCASPLREGSSPLGHLPRSDQPRRGHSPSSSESSSSAWEQLLQRQPSSLSSVGATGHGLGGGDGCSATSSPGREMLSSLDDWSVRPASPAALRSAS
jgi:hypothetical protein